MLWKEALWSIAFLFQMAQAHPAFLILQNIYIVSQISHGIPVGESTEGGPMRCGAGLATAVVAGALEGWPVADPSWIRPEELTAGSNLGPHLPQLGPGHQKEMYLIFKSLLEPKRIPTKQA